MCSSPRLIAAYHALHRLSMPRHPPNALLIRSRTLDRSPCDDTHQMSENREQMSELLTQVPVFPDLVCAMTRESAHANTHTVGDRCQRSEDRYQKRHPPIRAGIRHRPVSSQPDNPRRVFPQGKTGASPVCQNPLHVCKNRIRCQRTDVRHPSRTPQHNNLTNNGLTPAIDARRPSF